MLEQPVPEGLHPMEGTHTGAVCEELQPLALGKFVEKGRTHNGEVCGELSPIRGTSRLSRDGGGRETGLKLSPGRREGWGEGVVQFSFISHYPTLIGDKLNFLFSPSSVCFVRDANW